MHNKALNITKVLAPTPSNSPKYHIELNRKSGKPIKLADPTAIRAMIACMDMNAVIGGAASHYGGPAAFAEINSALYGLAFTESLETKQDWTDLYNIVNDAGHCENGVYALKANYSYSDLSLECLKKFRSIDSKLTGHGESHLFPEGVQLSNGPLGSAVAQAQGLAMADRLSNLNRVTVLTLSDGAAMEGEAKEALTSIPGLAKKGKLAPFVCILSDNNTKLSGRIDTDSYSMEAYFKSLELCGWKVISLEKGNDLQECLNTIEDAVLKAKSDVQNPILIHAKTIKGIGTAKTVESSSGGHGFPLKKASELNAFVQEIYNSKEIPTEINTWIQEIEQIPTSSSSSNSDVPNEKIQVGIANSLIKKYEAGYPIVSVSSDLAGSTGTKDFISKFPEASIDVGVAESNMVSVGAGLSKNGYIPVVDTFAQFGVTKGSLPLTMASLSQAPVIAIFSHTGFQDAADGASHQALSFFAMLSSIPHVDVYALSCSSEAEALLDQCIDTFKHKRENGEVPNSSIFFLGRENFPRFYNENFNYKLGKANIVKESNGSSNVCIIGVGSMLPEALEAASLLEKDGTSAIVINPSSINNIDFDLIGQAIGESNNNLIVVEEHQKISGFGANLVAQLSEKGIQVNFKHLAVNGQFGQSAYTAKELYQKHNIDSIAIYNAAKSF